MIKAARYLLIICLLFVPVFVIAGASEGKMQGNMYTYPVIIDGKQYTFLLGTGTSDSFIDTRVAASLQRQVTEKTKSQRETNKDPSSIIIPQMSVADHIVNQIQFKIVDFSSYTQLTGFPVDGGLGMDVYRQFIWDMDNKNKTLKMQSVSDNPQPENNYQQCIYYDMTDVPVITNITKDQKTIPFVLSTDSQFSAIAFSMIKPLHLTKINTIQKTKQKTKQSIKGQEVIQTEDNEEYYIENIDFENFHITKYRLDANFLPFPGGVLGMDFLLRFDQFRLNPVNNSLCFNHFDNSSKEVLRQISVRSYAGNIELYRNAENYLKKSGLENGDIIISINNKNYPPEEITEVRDVLTYSKTLDLQIKRHGNISHIMIN